MALEKEDIMALIAILKKGLDEEAPEVQAKPTKKKKTEPTKKKRGRVSAENSDNKFLSMGFDKLHKEDTAIDKILAKSPRAPRRKKFTYLNVTCRSCGKKEQISPSLLYETPDRYKCNTCSTSAG